MPAHEGKSKTNQSRLVNGLLTFISSHKRSKKTSNQHQEQQQKMRQHPFPTQETRNEPVNVPDSPKNNTESVPSGVAVAAQCIERRPSRGSSVFWTANSPLHTRHHADTHTSIETSATPRQSLAPRQPVSHAPPDDAAHHAPQSQEQDTARTPPPLARRPTYFLISPE